jgi:hypothetical protein
MVTWNGTTTTESATVSDGTNTYHVGTAVRFSASGSPDYYYTTFYFINTVGSNATVTATFNLTGRTFAHISIDTFSGVGAGTLNVTTVPAVVTTSGTGPDLIATATLAASARDLVWAGALDLNGLGAVTPGAQQFWQSGQAIALTLQSEYILAVPGGTLASTFGNASASDTFWGVGSFAFTPAGVVC